MYGESCVSDNRHGRRAGRGNLVGWRRPGADAGSNAALPALSEVV
jgi:hypothetical protein